MMEKIYGGYGLKNADDFYSHASGDIANETEVVKQNFGARMTEENVRAQLHQQYMNMMWRQLKYQQKAMRMQEIGAVLGVAGGLIGGMTSAKSPGLDTEQLSKRKGTIDPMGGGLTDEGLRLI